MYKSILRSKILYLTIVFLFAFSSFSIAQESQEERMKRLEEQLEAVTKEVKELRKTSSDNQRMDTIEEKLTILADEINEMKTQQSITGGDTALVSIFGGAPAASRIYTKDRGLSIGGYGELAVGQLKDEGTNTLDAQRVVFYTGYRFNEHIIFNSEIEFEHATTGSNLDGKEGSVSVEFALLDFLIRDYANLRGGILLAPFGMINEIHEPTTFFGVFRPSVERFIIPTTWREGGFGIFGTFDFETAGSFLYKAYIMNSFDSRGFKASNNRGLRLKGNRARFEDPAFVGRVEYDPYPGIKIGGSIFLGNTGQGESVSNPDSEFNDEKIDGFFQMYEADLQAQYRGFDIRTLAVWTFLDDAELINANNGFTGDESVGDEQFGWYVVGAYNILTEMDFNSRYLRYLAPFVRYEIYDTQKSVPTGFSSNPANDREEITVGLDYKPLPNVVLKADYQWLDNEASSSKNQFNFAMGYVF